MQAARQRVAHTHTRTLQPVVVILPGNVQQRLPHATLQCGPLTSIVYKCDVHTAPGQRWQGAGVAGSRQRLGEEGWSQAAPSALERWRHPLT